MALVIAAGIGLHNFSEGLAVGNSASTGAMALALTLIAGFALHNATEGFGIAAPLSAEKAGSKAGWGFLALCGLIGGGPTFVGTIVGYSYTSEIVSILFLALAGGALVYVINELLGAGRRLGAPGWVGWGTTGGFLVSFCTELVLAYGRPRLFFEDPCRRPDRGGGEGRAGLFPVRDGHAGVLQGALDRALEA